MSPSVVPTMADSPGAPGTTCRAAVQKIRSMVMPPLAMSHMQAATMPPGRVTRAISFTP